MALKSGQDMSVVTIAMMTSIVKSLSEITCCCLPMFRMMSSIRPREFIKASIAQDEVQDSPASLAACVQPPKFPSMAAALG